MSTPERLVTERKLRVVVALESAEEQIRAFKEMVGDKVTICWPAEPALAAT